MSERIRDRVAIGFMYVGAIAYLSVVGEALVRWPLDVRHSYLSELAAREQSTGWFFRMTDLVSSGSVLVATLLIVSVRGRWRSWKPFQRILVGGLLTFAIATIVDSTLTPLDCALSLPECQEQIAAGALGKYELLHNITSSIAGTGITIFSSALLAIGLKSGKECPDRGLMRFAMAVSFCVIALIAVLVVSELFGFAPVGVAQRIQVALSGVVIAFTPLPLIGRWRECG